MILYTYCSIHLQVDKDLGRAYYWAGKNSTNVSGNNANVNIDTIKSNLQAMYTMAKNAGLGVVSINISPWHTGTWSAPRQAVLEAVNAWIANTAIDIDFRIDAYTLLEDPANLTYLLPAYSSDGLHLSTAGYQAVGTEVYNVAFA